MCATNDNDSNNRIDSCSLISDDDLRDCFDVIVVGGGSVGLFLCCRLNQLGLRFLMIEKEEQLPTHSRAIGIHGPSLAYFEELGLLEELLAQGVPIPKVRFFMNSPANDNNNNSKCDPSTRRAVMVGSVNLNDLLDPPHNYSFACPQYRTMSVLQRHLQRNLHGTASKMLTGVSATAIRNPPITSSSIIEANFAEVDFVDKNGHTRTARARFICACDGKKSFVRELCNIEFEGTKYPDTFMMADVEDVAAIHHKTKLQKSSNHSTASSGNSIPIQFSNNSSSSNSDINNDINNNEAAQQVLDKLEEGTAALFLTDDGVVESFPLPDGVRRWVCWTGSDGILRTPSLEAMQEMVYNRIGIRITASKEALMLSSFAVQGFVAKTFVRNRVILVGDSAHVCSPLGGQGMNLGWMDAVDISNTLHSIITATPSAANATHRDQQRHAGRTVKLLQQYNSRRRRVAKTVVRRAEFNTAMGRRMGYTSSDSLFVRTYNSCKRLVVHTLLFLTPLHTTLARLFTMHDLVSEHVAIKGSRKKSSLVPLMMTTTVLMVVLAALAQWRRKGAISE